jgi:hypothetical protein
MNDFERKLQQQPFRTPPPDLRAAICDAPAHLIVPARWTWRDWFWPSPQAWGALAALWLIFAVLAVHEQKGSTKPTMVELPPSSSESLFLAFHHRSHASHALELFN